jgi:DNA-binding MarR family transcriptional regulator
LLRALNVAGRRLSTATVMFHQAVADRLGLNPTDHKCVDLLLMKGPLTAGELAVMTAMTTGAITAALDRLERAGMVRREDDPRDRRRVIVRVVSRKVDAIARLFDGFAARLDEIAARYSDDELAIIVDYLDRTAPALHQSSTELRAQGPRADRRGRGKPE